MSQSNLQDKKSSLCLYLSILTLFLFFLEISITVKCGGIYFSDYRLVSSHFKIPSIVYPDILFFIFAHFLLHVVFFIGIWGLTKLVALSLKLSLRDEEKCGIFLWIIALLAILLANRVWFPNSKFSFTLFSWMPDSFAVIVFFLASVVILIAFLIAVYGLAVYLHQLPWYGKLTGATLALVCLIPWYFSKPPPSVIAAKSTHPNIILIGFDSLRPDFLGFFGSHVQTPNLDQFLNESTVFSEAMTPIARTYPSWTTILSGLHPKVSGVRTNLQNQVHLNTNKMLPYLLKQKGYQTIFATDEVRFSNIDQHFGYDQVLTPIAGFNDFFLGTLNDFPLSNLLVNSSLGAYLFPYSYANRAAYFVYQPESFMQKIESALDKSTHPLFLTIHFCLTHHPYAWNRIYLPDQLPSVKDYQSAIQEIDLHFGRLMQQLKQTGFLDNAIVVLLSDHGEALHRKGDRITDPELFLSKKPIPDFFSMNEEQAINVSVGHGTDVLGLTQYHTLLAFRYFQFKSNIKRIVPGMVSLINVKPTILDALGVSNSDGNSLAPYISGHRKKIHPHHILVESDFSPAGILSIHPELGQVLLEGLDYFWIHPQTGRVIVKNSMLKSIIASKQFADYFDSWALALYPKKNNSIPILVNLKTGEWVSDLNTAFARQSPAALMLSHLKQRYGKEIKPLLPVNNPN